jgi:transposase
MKEVEIKHQFVELRAQGKSLRTASDELKIGLQTAVRWERELKEQIENRKVMEIDALLERHQLTVLAQIERYSFELARVTEELKKRDLSDVPTPKLYDIMGKLHARVDDALPTLTLRDDDEIAASKELDELVAARRSRKASEVNAHAGRNDNGDSTVRAEDLVTQLLVTLQRLRAGEINERTAATEMGIIGSIFKGIEIADLQARLERIESTLEKDRT